MTLDPDFHETLESEANFGAGQLIFLGERFGQEARDYPRNFESIKTLKDVYKNSMMSTLWRFVEEREPTEASFGLVSRHPLHPNIGGAPNGEPVYKFVASSGFHMRFPGVTANQIYETLRRHSKWSRRGPVVNGDEYFADVGATKRMFHLDGFCTSHQVLTYGYQVT